MRMTLKRTAKNTGIASIHQFWEISIPKYWQANRVTKINIKPNVEEAIAR
jgi:hypothetical protein